MVQQYIRAILRHPLLFIQLPLLIVFTLSYDILYDFTVKQFNSVFYMESESSTCARYMYREICYEDSVAGRKCFGYGVLKKVGD